MKTTIPFPGDPSEEYKTLVDEWIVGISDSIRSRLFDDLMLAEYPNDYTILRGAVRAHLLTSTEEELIEMFPASPPALLKQLSGSLRGWVNASR